MLDWSPSLGQNPFAMFHQWISPLATLVIQLCALGVLIWYACDTRKIRKASIEQAESAQKPCLALVTGPRDFDETVLEKNGVVGGTILARRNGNVAVENVGNGPALNVSYDFRPVDQSNIVRPRGYLPNIVVGKSWVLAVPHGILDIEDYEIVFIYDSMSRQKYESITSVKGSVVADFRFGPVTPAGIITS